MDSPGKELPGKSWASKKDGKNDKKEAKKKGRKVFAFNVISLKSFNLKNFQF